jgi:uncharacterized protein (TIGR02118 family)
MELHEQLPANSVGLCCAARYEYAAASLADADMYKVTRLIESGVSLPDDRDYRARAMNSVGANACIETFRAGTLDLGELEDAPYGGSAETWFDDEKNARSFAANRMLLETLWGDDKSAAPLLVTRVQVVLGDPASEPVTDGLKGIFVFRRKPGMTVAEFQSHWLHTHGPIAAQTPRTSRYVQCHVLPSHYTDGTPPYDGITELYWDTLEDARLAMTSDSMAVDQSTDSQNFVDPTSVKLAIVRCERLF